MIEASHSQDCRDYVTLAACFNNSALIFAYLGRPDFAMGVCDSALDWITKLENDSPTLCRLALPSWVNKGRLLATTGQIERALSYFVVGAHLAAHGEVSFGPFRINRKTWGEIQEIDPQLLGVLHNIHVIDSLKAYIRSRDYVAALSFIGSLREAKYPVSLETMISEGRTVVEMHMGLYETALASAGDLRGHVSIYGSAVLSLHSIGVHIALGQDALAKRLARGLALFVETNADVAPAQSLLKFMVQLGSYLERLGDTPFAESIYTSGLELAVQKRDQPMQWLFLKALLDLPTERVSSRKELWRTEVEVLLRQCEYSSVLKAAGRRSNGLYKVRGTIYDKLNMAIKDAIKAVT